MWHTPEIHMTTKLYHGMYLGKLSCSALVNIDVYAGNVNALPADVTSAPSLFTFRKRLKLHLFPLSYLGLVL